MWTQPEIATVRRAEFQCFDQSPTEPRKFQRNGAVALIRNQYFRQATSLLNDQFTSIWWKRANMCIIQGKYGLYSLEKDELAMMS